MKVLSKKQIFSQYNESLVEDNQTFSQILDELGFPESIYDHVQIRVNGQIVNREFWKYARPNNGTNVAVALVPAGGNSNDLFRTAFTLGAIALGGAAGASLIGGGASFASLTFGQQVGRGLVAGAFSLLGSQLANSMFPPNTPGLPESRRGNKLSSVTGQSNQFTPNDVVIRNYGRNRIYPRVVAQPFTYYVGKDQYIVALYDFGSGIQEIDVGTLTIGDTPITQFANVDYNIASKGNFRIYSNRVNSNQINFLFEDLGDTVSRTSPENSDSIELSFTWPNGLVGFFGRKQKRRELLQDLIIEMKEVGTSSWININEFDVELDPGIQANKFNVFVLGLPDESTFVDSYTVTTPGIFGGSGSSTSYSNYSVSFTSSNLFFHRPVESGDDISIPDTYTNRFLVAGDRVKFGSEEFKVIEGNVSTKEHGGKTFQAARLNKILGFRSRFNSFETTLTTNNGEFDSGKFLPVITGSSVNDTIRVSRRTTSGFRHEIKINPKQGPKQWDVRVIYAGLDVEGFYNLTSSDTNLIKNFNWDQIKGYGRSEPVSTNVTHKYLEVKAKASEEINGQIETISAEVESLLPWYDTVNSVWKTKKSSNPAWVFASILTNESNQRAIPLSQLDEVSLSAWAEYCENNLITYQGNEVGFQCNFVHDYPITVKQLLEEVCSVGRATININNGKYGVVIDQLRTTPTQMFNQRNIISMNTSRAYIKTPDGIRVKYVDPLSNWQENTIIAYDDGKNINNAEVIEDIEAFGCTSLAQAWRQGRYFLAKQKLRKDNIQIVVDFEGLACSRGDLVYFSHDVLKEGGLPARVKSVVGNIVTIDEIAVDQGGTQVLTVRTRVNGNVSDYNIISFPSDYEIEVDDVSGIQSGDLCVYGVQDEVVKKYIVKSISYSEEFKADIELIEYNEDIYTADSDVIPDYIITTSSNPLGKSDVPSKVLNLSYVYNIDINQGQKRYIYNVDLNWEAPLKGKVKTYEVYLTVNGETKLIAFSESSELNYELNSSYIGLPHKFVVLATNALGEKMNLGAADPVIFTPTDDETAPENVDNFNANILTDTIELDWTFVDSLDIDRYSIRFSNNTETASWEQSTPITNAGPTQSTATVPLRTGTYLIRAIDYAGNKSPQASKVVTSVPEISKIEFISTVSAPNWNGVFEDTELLGDSLLLKSINDQDSFVSDIGEFFFQEVFDLGDIFTARFIADVSASGFSKTGLMKNWTTLAEIDPIAGQFNDDDFDASAYIRTRNEPDTMINWTPLSSVDYLSFGSELTATPWVKFKAGDFTGRIFQLKIRLEAGDITVSPIVYSVNIEANWNERLINGQDQLSGTQVVFDGAFVERPAIEITAIQNFSNGDYYNFISLDETGFLVQFYDTNDNPVNDRTFDYIAKGIGKKYTLEDINF